MDDDFNSEIIILSPNLGNPIILNHARGKKQRFRFNSLILHRSNNSENLNKFLVNSITLGRYFYSWKQNGQKPDVLI